MFTPFYTRQGPAVLPACIVGQNRYISKNIAILLRFKIQKFAITIEKYAKNFRKIELFSI